MTTERTELDQLLARIKEIGPDKPNWLPVAKDAMRMLPSVAAKLKNLRQSLVCDVCCGDGKTPDCICKGTGDALVARNTLREEMVEAQIAIHQATGENNVPKSIADFIRQVAQERDLARTNEARMAEALKPFGSGGFSSILASGDNSVLQDRIVDWFGPSDFGKAASALIASPAPDWLAQRIAEAQRPGAASEGQGPCDGSSRGADESRPRSGERSSEMNCCQQCGGTVEYPEPLCKTCQLRAQLADAQAALKREEKRHEQTIGERDDAQEAFDALVAELGVETEYSNLRSIEDVLSDAIEEVKRVEGERDALAAALEDARGVLRSLRNEKPVGTPSEAWLNTVLRQLSDPSSILLSHDREVRRQGAVKALRMFIAG